MKITKVPAVFASRTTALIAVLIALFMLPLTAVANQPEGPAVGEDGKVYVCKYVGTPGTNERLKEGLNPIHVDANTLRNISSIDFHNISSGDEWTDRHGRSVVVNEGETCPAHTPDTTTTTTSTPTTSTTSAGETTTTFGEAVTPLPTIREDDNGEESTKSTNPQEETTSTSPSTEGTEGESEEETEEDGETLPFTGMDNPLALIGLALALVASGGLLIRQGHSAR